MHEIWQILLAGSVGVGVGVVYFGGLWLTVRRLPDARRPALLLLGSVVGRTVLTLLGFYLVMGARWERLLACLAGFILARMVLVRRLGPPHAAPGGRER
jgi:F1F0 ATPase subunit 2